MALTIASSKLSDTAFLAAFHTCELPLSLFHHGDHLRFAWLILHSKDFNEAVEIVRDGIQRFAAHHNVGHIFHETVTRAWVALLASHPEPSFATFIKGNEDRLNQELLHRFWTQEALNSSGARICWVPPDKLALPSRM